MLTEVICQELPDDVSDKFGFCLTKLNCHIKLNKSPFWNYSFSPRVFSGFEEKKKLLNPALNEWLNFKTNKILSVYISPPSGREQHCLSVEMLKKKKSHIVLQHTSYSSCWKSVSNTEIHLNFSLVNYLGIYSILPLISFTFIFVYIFIFYLIIVLLLNYGNKILVNLLLGVTIWGILKLWFHLDLTKESLFQFW